MVNFSSANNKQETTKALMNNMEEITMAQLLDSIRKRAKVNYKVDLELQNLIYIIASADCDKDSELNYMTSLLEVSPGDAREIVLRVDNSIIELEYHVKTFKAAHDEYVKKIKEYIIERNKEIDETFGPCRSNPKSLE